MKKSKKSVTKEVTATIEQEVVFMVDPTVDFVSLVKHGANRAPFKILKSKGGSKMNKVLQAILIRHGMPDDEVQKALEGMETKNVEKFDSYDSYIQVPMDQFKPESMAVVKADDGVYSIFGELSEGSEKGKVVMDAKQAVDYATMDSLYSELYAMADIVSGAMRQENAETSFRADTILKAIDNFRAYAEVVLQNISEQKAVKLEDHPHLAYPLVKQETSEGGEGEGGEEDEAAAAAAAAAAAEGEDTGEEVSKELRDAIEKISTGIDSLSSKFDDFEKRLKAIEDKSEANEKAVKAAEESIKEVKSTVKSGKSQSLETSDTGDDNQKKGTFKGVFFRTIPGRE